MILIPDEAARILNNLYRLSFALSFHDQLCFAVCDIMSESAIIESISAPAKEISWFQDFVTEKLEKIKPTLLELLQPGT